MNLHLVHERADQKNSSTGSLKQIFRRQGVGDLAHVQPLTLVTNRDYQIDGCSLQYQTDFFAGIVSIAMKHRVYRRFTHRHGDSHALVFIKADVHGLQATLRAGERWGRPAAAEGLGERVAEEGPAPLPLLLAVEEAQGISRTGQLSPR